MLFNNSDYSIWSNSSYYKGASASYIGYINVHDSTGMHIDELNFRFYVNDTLLGFNYLLVSDSYIYTIAVKDVFNTTISTSTISPSRDMIIVIELYTLKIYSELVSKFIYFNLTNSGGARYSEHIGHGEVVKFLLYPGVYTYRFQIIDGGIVTDYTGIVNVNGDVSFIIDAISMRELLNAIELDIHVFTSFRPVVTEINEIFSDANYIVIGVIILIFLIIVSIVYNLTIEEELDENIELDLVSKIKKKLKRRRKKRVGLKNES